MFQADMCIIVHRACAQISCNVVAARALKVGFVVRAAARAHEEEEDGAHFKKGLTLHMSEASPL